MQIQNCSPTNFEYAKSSLSLQFILCTVFMHACVPCANPTRPNLLRCSERTLNFTVSTTFQFFLIQLGLVFITFSLCSSHLKVRYVSFDTDLSTLRKSSAGKKDQSHLFLILFCLLICDIPPYITIAMLFHDPVDISSFVSIFSMRRKLISRVCPFFLSLNMSISAVCPSSHFLCLIVMFITCTLISRKVPVWISILLVLLSNDIELNPGPGLSYNDNFFTFMNWNLNSLSKDNFQRVQAIEAHNSLFNYDLISICETSLNDSIKIPDPLLDNYTFLPANHPDNVAHGGVGLFYKNTLPLKRREDLSFEESIVVELKFGRKKIFFTVLYRTPSIKFNSPGFNEFLSNFKSLHTNIQNENPYAVFFTGDFNGHSKFWWDKGDTTPEGKAIEELFLTLGLSQVISEPANFTPNKNPSCIDLLVTDQPNLILDSGTRPSLDPKCHHQIVY